MGLAEFFRCELEYSHRPADWGIDGISTWAQSQYLRWPTARNWQELADQLASPRIRNLTVSIIGHALNSEFHFRPVMPAENAPPSNLPRTLTPAGVPNFIDRLRAAIGPGGEIPQIVFVSCCIANTSDEGDLLQALTRPGSPIASACGSTREVLLTRQLVRVPAGPSPIPMYTLEIAQGSWRCLERPGAFNIGG